MKSQKHEKSDVISYDEFNELIDHTDFHHDPPPSEVIPQDENSNQMNETLLGMEYDFDTGNESEADEEDAQYEEELALELAENGESESDEADLESNYVDYDDFEGDIEADLKKHSQHTQQGG